MSDGNVVAFPGCTDEGEIEAREDIAELFEKLAEMARAGEIHSIICIGHNATKNSVMMATCSPEVGTFQLIGALETVKKQILDMPLYGDVVE
jgi:hypothetical protein